MCLFRWPFFERKKNQNVFCLQFLHLRCQVEEEKNYQTKVCYFWNIMCSFQQGRRLHLLSSDTSFLRPLKFVDIFFVCFNKACLTSHCLHWCRGFSEDCCILYPCGQKDTGLSFLFPFPFQRIYLWNLPTEVWPMPDPQEFRGVFFVLNQIVCDSYCSC